MKDIRIDNFENKFKFRVAGIVEKANKILIVKMNDNPFYCFPGGHVEILEDTKSACTRELKEELYFDVKILDLILVGENFYKLRNSNFHELCFYYKATPNVQALDFSDKTIKENDNGFIVTHEFKWVDKKNLKNYDIRPKELVEIILKDNKNINHIISKF